MRRCFLANLAALASIPHILAQSLTGSVSTSTSVVEVFDASCSDVDQVTDYSTITITTCPACTEHPGPITKHTTVYTTTFASLCETGWTSQAHVITETCTGETPIWSSGSNYIPPGFTETVTICTVCGSKPTKVTLTVPCEETGAGVAAAPGSPPKPPGVPAQPTPLAGNSPGHPHVGGGNPGTPNSGSPPYPTGANSTLIKCPGSPYCHGPGAAEPSNAAGLPGSGPAGSKPAPPMNAAAMVTIHWGYVFTALLFLSFHFAS